MSMWYDFAGVLILNDSVCPTSTLIEVAKPWIVGFPAPLTCQSLGGSPGSVFSQAITLVTGGPHGPAAAGLALASNTKPKTTASITPMTERCFRTRWARNPLTDMPAPRGEIRRSAHRRAIHLFTHVDAQPIYSRVNDRSQNGHSSYDLLACRPDGRDCR